MTEAIDQDQPSIDDSKASVINGLAGVAAAVATEEALSHIPIGGAAGFVAATVGGLVVYGLDHTEFGKSVERAVLPDTIETAIMPDCLPMTSVIDEVVQLVSHPFEPLSAGGDEFIDQAGSSNGIVSEIANEGVDNIIYSEPVMLPTDLSPAQQIVDDMARQGVVICDPPPQEIDGSNHGLGNHHNDPYNLI